MMALRESKPPYKLLWANPAFIQVYESAGKVVSIGQSWDSLLCGPGADTVFELIKHVIETGEPYHTNFFPTAAAELYSNTTFTDDESHRDWSIIPVKNDRGEVHAVLSVSRDTSASEHLNITRKRMKALLDTIPSGVIIVQPPDGRIIQANPRAAELYGRDPEPGTLFRDHIQKINVSNSFGEPISEAELPLLRSLKKGEIVRHFEVRVDNQDGTHRHLLINTAPLKDEDDKILGAVGALDDITELKDAQESLSRAYLQEKQISVTLQQALLPNIPESIGDISIASAYIPAFNEFLVGGDFYDIFYPEPGLVGIAIGDVSGKGIRAAVLTAKAKYALHAFACIDPEPEHVLTKMNEMMCRFLDDASFITMFYCLLNLNEGTITFTNAGHEPPLWHRRKSAGVEELNSCGPPLAIVHGHLYEESKMEFNSGHSLFMYTDGVTEARLGQDFFELERVKNLLLQNDELPPNQVVSRLVQEIEHFSNGDLRDDMAMLLLSSNN